MKTKFKILSLLTLALSLFAVTASAQFRYAPNTLISSNAATIAATAGTNVAIVFDVPHQPYVALQIETMADASGAYVLTIPVQYSVDGQQYSGMAANSIAISFNGVTKQTIVTNVPTHGCAYLRIPHLTNATASINVTNFILKAAVNTQNLAP